MSRVLRTVDSVRRDLERARGERSAERGRDPARRPTARARPATRVSRIERGPNSDATWYVPALRPDLGKPDRTRRFPYVDRSQPFWLYWYGPNSRLVISHHPTMGFIGIDHPTANANYLDFHEADRAVNAFVEKLLTSRSAVHDPAVRRDSASLHTAPKPSNVQFSRPANRRASGDASDLPIPVDLTDEEAARFLRGERRIRNYIIREAKGASGQAHGVARVLAYPQNLNFFQKLFGGRQAARELGKVRF